MQFDVLGDNLNQNLLEGHNPMPELAESVGVVKRMEPIPLLEVGNETALEDFAYPEHIPQARAIQGMSRKSFVVRRLHPRSPAPQPNENHRALISVVEVGSQREPRFADVACDQNSPRGIGFPRRP